MPQWHLLHWTAFTSNNHTKHSRTKESDASPSGILSTFLIHTTISKLTGYSISNSIAYVNITDINNVVAIEIDNQ
jgi:hypothetical protein